MAGTIPPHQGPPESLLKRIEARYIYDSLGYPTLEVDVWTAFSGEEFFRASVPTALSVGVHEAKELRDGKQNEFKGKHVTRAIGNVKSLGQYLINKKFDVSNQVEIDKFLKKTDGTDDKSQYGTVAMIALSMAVCRAGAARKGVPLYKHIADLAENSNLLMPVPLFNVINGGNRAANDLIFQEFMIMPTGAASYKEALNMGCSVYQILGKKIEEKFGVGSSGIGDNGAYAPRLKELKDVFDLLGKAISEAGYNGKFEYAIDCAASDFCIKEEKTYNLDYKNPKANPKNFIDGSKLANQYCKYISQFKISSIEDPFDEEDLETWPNITKCANIQIVSNDLTASNPILIKNAAELKAANCFLLKLNQTGTVMEAIEACNVARRSGCSVIVSQRSGETEDSFIADLAVGLGNGQIKAGAPARYERIAKYNQLLRIENELGEVPYAGTNYRHPWGNGGGGAALASEETPEIEENPPAAEE